MYKKNDLLCVIKDPFGSSDNTDLHNPQEGVIVGINNLPLIHEGEDLYQLAVFPRMEQAASHLEDWKEKSKEQLKQLGTDN